MKFIINFWFLFIYFFSEKCFLLFNFYATHANPNTHKIFFLFLFTNIFVIPLMNKHTNSFVKVRFTCDPSAASPLMYIEYDQNVSFFYNKIHM